VFSESGREIVYGSYQTRSAPEGEREANARLIAAAPELLAALEAVLDANLDAWDRLVMSGSLVGDPESEPYVIAARAAIAKARGGK
jgi:enamine deaminase RidA (YjgF/YER057c/UK114 family)